MQEAGNRCSNRSGWAGALSGFLLFIAMWLLAAPDDGKAGNSPFAADGSTIALYHFDTGAQPGAELKDASPNGLDLTVSGNVRFVSSNLAWMAAHSGTVARFGGWGDGLSVNIPAALIIPQPADRLTSFTLEARIFPHRYNGAGRGDSHIVSLNRGYDSHVLFYEPVWPGDEEPLLRSRNAEGTDYVAIPQTDFARTLTRDEWHLLRITVEGASGAVGQLTVYVDNAVVGSVPVSINYASPGDWTLTVGNFIGDLDEVRVSRGVIPTPALPPRADFKQYFQELYGIGTTALLEMDYDGTAPVIAWKKQSGPGTVTFSGRAFKMVDGVKKAYVHAKFSAPGKYVIRGEVGDSDATAQDFTVVNVWPDGGGPPGGKKVLFSGHSLVYTGPVPYIVQDMAQASGDQESVVKMFAYPDRRIAGFWYLPNDDGANDFPDFPYLQDLAAATDWDIIVLTLYPRWCNLIDGAAEAQNDIFYSKLFGRYFRKQGIRTMIFAVAESELATARAIADAVQAKIIPATIVWDDIHAAAGPGIYDFFSYPHPTGLGLIINTLTSFQAIYGHPPTGYPMPGMSPSFRSLVEQDVEKVISRNRRLFIDRYETP